MRRLFTKISSAALLFCLASHHSFSMEPGEEDSGKHLASLPLTQRSAQEDQALERGASQRNTEEALPMKIIRYNFKYETFREAYFDLIDTKFPQFLKTVQGVKGKVPLERFLSLCDGYLEAMTLPFVLFLEDNKTIINMMPKEIEEGISISVPANLTAHLPLTREDNFRKQAKLASTASLVQGKSEVLPPRDPALGQVAIPDIIRLSFNICETRVALLEAKREALSEDREEKERLLREAVDVYRKYLLYIDPFEKMIELPQNHLTFLEHKIKVLSSIPFVLENLAFFYFSQDKKDAYIEVLSAKGAYMSLQLKVIHEYQNICKDKEIVKKQRLLLRNLFNLSIMEYGFHFQSNLQKAQEAYGRAENYNHQIKECGEEFKDIYLENRERLEVLRIKSCSVSGRGKQIHQEQEIERITQALISLEIKISKNPSYSEHRKFTSSLAEIFKKYDRSPAEIKKVQDQIALYENKLLEREESTSLVPSEIDGFYQKCKTVLLENVDELVCTNNMLVNFFIISGQFERGLNHMNSFKKIYEGPEQRTMDIKSAFLKALQGDPEEFLAFEEVYRIEKAQKVDQKKRKKEEKRKNLASAIRAEQEKSAHSKSLNELQSAPSSLEGKKKLRTPPVFEDSSYKSSFSASEIEPSTEEEKEEKRKRHHEKLEERRKGFEQEAIRIQAATAAVDEDAGEARGGVAQAEAAVGEDSWFSFGKNIQLTTAQKHVDLEIESNAWNFTKAELERYYEEFGCKVSQNGRHTKAALPAYKDVRLPDGTPLSVMFEERDTEYEGGSFTLPNWQDQVPFYLRKQILKARGKIQAYYDLLDKVALHQLEQKHEE